MDFNGDVEGLVRCAQPNSPALWGGGQGAGQLMEVRSPGRTTDRIEDTTGDAGVSPAVSLAQTV